jgi:hypothetical protein
MSKSPKTPHASSERHYTVWEIAELWHVSHITIRRLFKNEPGILVFGTEETRFKRGKKTMRIPESVMVRVHRKLGARG